MNTFSACFPITGGIISPSHTHDRISAQLNFKPCVLPGFVFLWVLCFVTFCVCLWVSEVTEKRKSNGYEMICFCEISWIILVLQRLLNSVMFMNMLVLEILRKYLCKMVKQGYYC